MIEGRSKKVEIGKRNFLFCFFISTFYFLFSFFSPSSSFAADEGVTQAVSEIGDTLSDAKVDLQETAKPIFDPKVFDALHPEAETLLKPDDFSKKMQKKRADFIAKQQKKKKAFYEDISSKNLSPEDYQKAMVEFYQETKKDEKKFFDRQQKKLKKYRDEQLEEEAKRKGKDNPSQKLLFERQKFMFDQGERKKEFTQSLNEDRRSGKISEEEVPAKIQKFSEEQLARLQEFSAKQREQIEKNSAQG